MNTHTPYAYKQAPTKQIVLGGLPYAMIHPRCLNTIVNQTNSPALYSSALTGPGDSQGTDT